MLEIPRGNLYPVLPLRDIVVFPAYDRSPVCGREKSVRALEDVMKDDKQILLVTQKNAAQDDPSPSDIYSVGTVGTVLQLLKLPDGTVKVLVEGGQRARIVKFAGQPQFCSGLCRSRTGGNRRRPRDRRPGQVGGFPNSSSTSSSTKRFPPEVLVSINQIEDSSKLADTVASHLTLRIPEKQDCWKRRP